MVFLPPRLVGSLSVISTGWTFGSNYYSSATVHIQATCPYPLPHRQDWLSQMHGIFCHLCPEMLILWFECRDCSCPVHKGFKILFWTCALHQHAARLSLDSLFLFLRLFLNFFSACCPDRIKVYIAPIAGCHFYMSYDDYSLSQM